MYHVELHQIEEPKRPPRRVGLCRASSVGSVVWPACGTTLGFMLYWPFACCERLNEQTSHIDCRVFEYGAAGVGIYRRAAGGEVRFVVYLAVAVRGSAAQRGC